MHSINRIIANRSESEMIIYAPQEKAIPVDELLYYLTAATATDIARLVVALEKAHYDD